MQKLSPSNILQLDNLPGFPAKADFLLGQYLREIGLRPSVYLASSLPMEGNEYGDFRFVGSERTFYTWTGTIWEPLFGLSGRNHPEQQNFIEGINPSLRNQLTSGMAEPRVVYASGVNAWSQARSDGTLTEATVSAVYAGVEGALFTSGAFVSAAPFTAAGGKPAINGICFLAAASDDGGAGAGKFTAKAPEEKGRWVVRCGTVVDNTNYDTAKTCEIIFYPDYPIQL